MSRVWYEFETDEINQQLIGALSNDILLIMMSNQSIIYKIILLFSINFVLGQNQGDEEVWKGVYDFYDYRTEPAILTLTQARIDYPKNPAVHLTWASARWLNSQENDAIEKTYSVLIRDLDEVIPIYKKLIKEYPDNPQYRLFLGSAIGLKARVHLGRKEWIKTLGAAYKGFKIVKKVSSENPDLYDSMLPIGIVEYYAGMSGLIVKWAATLFGLETTKEAGLKKIEIAANQGEFAWIEARSVLGFLYLWVDSEPEKALSNNAILVEHFPNNFYFNIMYLESLILAGSHEEANKILTHLEQTYDELTDTQKIRYRSYLQYERALFHFSIGEFESASQFVDISLTNYDAEFDMILASAWLLRGKLYDITGDRVKAKVAYKNCRKLDNNTVAIKLAKRYLDNPFTIKK